MPNWSYNHIALKGDKKTINSFIRFGLQNIGIEPQEELNKNFELLSEQAEKENVTLRTFLPMPETFKKYDTTNYPERYSEQASYQKGFYGAVGWYDYNIQTLGTEWDADMEDIKLDENNDEDCRFYFYSETAWSFPREWCLNMKKIFPDLKIYISADEEALLYDIIGEVDEEEVFDISAIKQISAKLHYEEEFEENEISSDMKDILEKIDEFIGLKDDYFRRIVDGECSASELNDKLDALWNEYVSCLPEDEKPSEQ